MTSSPLSTVMSAPTMTMTYARRRRRDRGIHPTAAQLLETATDLIDEGGPDQYHW